MLICIFPFVLESVLLEVHLYYSSFQRQTVGFIIFSGIIFIFCFITVWSVDQKKNACESCELSFIGGDMRTSAQETAPELALRNCFKEAKGWSVYMWFCEGRIHTIKHTFFVEIFYWSHEASASHLKQSSPWRILVFS